MKIQISKNYPKNLDFIPPFIDYMVLSTDLKGIAQVLTDEFPEIVSKEYDDTSYWAVSLLAEEIKETLEEYHESGFFYIWLEE